MKLSRENNDVCKSDCSTSYDLHTLLRNKVLHSWISNIVLIQCQNMFCFSRGLVMCLKWKLWFSLNGWLNCYHTRATYRSRTWSLYVPRIASFIVHVHNSPFILKTMRRYSRNHFKRIKNWVERNKTKYLLVFIKYLWLFPFPVINF